MGVISFLKTLLPEEVKKYIRLHTRKYYTKSYSQEGKDLILNRIFEGEKEGFYVDVGAHHPFRFSNTFLFYTRGWRGINIDANPESIILLNKFRKRDININLGVGEKQGTLNYYMFNEPALNTFNENLAKERDGLGKYKLIKTIPVKIMPLRDILNQYMPPNTIIDFMTIDCEGMDFDVLQSNDWDKFRPNVLLVEVIPAKNFAQLMSHPINEYMESKGYEIFAKTFNTCIYLERSFKRSVLR